ncbi:MAG: fumarylacetoacetase [Kineosporiaceae bacterium]|nr:fumarylacetoacetase [Aeromicrobium sp.]
MTEDFGRFTLPFCSFVVPGEDHPRVGVGVDTDILDLTTAAAIVVPDHEELFAAGTLDSFLAAGFEDWEAVRYALTEWLGTEPIEGPTHEHVVDHHLVPADSVELRMPFAVSDYVDFYASEEHASNLGKILRPGQEPLTPNWKHLPIGYHGRAGTVVASGTPIVRPQGQRRTPEGGVVFGPTVRLDIETELGFVVGTGSTMGEPVGLADFDRHVFGICLLNDWSARDIQGWEYAPLGPFLGKSFATSISPWIVPLAALSQARVHAPERTTQLLPYLDDATAEPWGLDLHFEASLNGSIISRPPYAGMYWTPAQMLAHMTVNGASLHTGDLYGSGTISGPSPDQRGSLIELSWNGQEPIKLDDGSTRTFLEDGDTVTITATAAGPGGQTLYLGAVEGTIVPNIEHSR